jgi:phosphoglycolate phosphatase-like HAD superfamily hydrolase
MKINHRMTGILCAALLFAVASGSAAAPDPLPSWNDGATKDAIVEFVTAVTTKNGSDYVEPAERIATFDNDGTLWIEQPIYTQLAFAVDRVKALAPQHPEWKTTQPFKALLEGDHAALAASGTKGIAEIVMTTHAGMTTDEFEQIVVDWLATARHPKYDRPYTQLVYQPMLELLAYLRTHGFKTFIVSGGGIGFMRPFTQDVYGIPPEQVVGSMGETTFELRDGKPVLIKEPKLFFMDDKEGKPIAIQKFIGRRPILAFGNSDGDMQMLQWTTAGSGRRLGLIVHHDDTEREYAYDRKSKIGTLDKALDAAGPAGWVVVSMQNDWQQVFPTK